MDATKAAELATTSRSTSPTPSAPRGRCRDAVRGLAASNARSTSRLNAIAADRAAEEARVVPARVERWFGESNFHHSEFADLERLVHLKEQGRQTIILHPM